jgi:hypothetical protein
MLFFAAATAGLQEIYGFGISAFFWTCVVVHEKKILASS